MPAAEEECLYFIDPDHCNWNVEFLSRNTGRVMVLSNMEAIPLQPPDDEGDALETEPFMFRVNTKIRIKLPCDHVVLLVKQDTPHSVDGISVAVGVVDSGYRGYLTLVLHSDGSCTGEIPPLGIAVRVTVCRLGPSIESDVRYPYEVGFEDPNADSPCLELHQVDVNDVQLARVDLRLVEEWTYVPDPLVVMFKAPVREQIVSDLYSKIVLRVPLPSACLTSKYRSYRAERSLASETALEQGFRVIYVGIAADSLFVTLVYEGLTTNVSTSDTIKIELSSSEPPFLLRGPFFDNFYARAQGDAGYDLRCPRHLTVLPGGSTLVTIEERYRGHPSVTAAVFGKSSLNDKGLVVHPCVWQQDRNLRFLVSNVSNQPLMLRAQQKMAQVVPIRTRHQSFADHPWFEGTCFPCVCVEAEVGIEAPRGGDAMLRWRKEEVIDVTETQRGEKGFGSTGTFEEDDDINLYRFSF